MIRNSRLRPVLVLLAGSLAAVGVTAQDTHSEKMGDSKGHPQQVRMRMPDSTTFTVTAENGVPEIPFKLINNHLILQIRVNGSAALKAVLDTGMPTPGLVLYQGPRTRDVGLEFDPNMKVQIAGAGGEGARLEAHMALGASFELEGLTIGNASVIALPELADFGGYHDAIIGYSIFERFVVELDYDRGMMRLFDPASYEAPANAKSVPMTLRHNMPFVNVQVTPYGQETFDAEVVVDLGASHAISLNTNASEKITVPEKSLHTTLGHGLSGSVEGEVGRLASVELGGARVTDVLASFPVAGHQNPRGMDSRAGNLGSEILRRFTTTFDYSRKQMLLVPNESYAEPFEWDHSGLKLGVGGKLKVESIIPGSPAEEAGVLVGDLVTHLDGRAVTAVDYGDVRDALVGAGEVRLTLLRGEEKLEKTVALRRLI